METPDDKFTAANVPVRPFHRFIPLSDHKNLFPLLMHHAQPRISDSVYLAPFRAIHKDWNLSAAASCLCLSCRYKEKAQNENTSWQPTPPAECVMP